MAFFYERDAVVNLREIRRGKYKSQIHSVSNTPISSVSPADAEGTVASSSKINEPFRRP